MDALLQAARAPDYPAEPRLVIANRPDAKGIETAKSAGVDTRVIDHKAYDSREAFEAEIHKALTDADIELVALAGFMRVLTPWLVERWAGRLINIHPAILPSFPGLNTHQRALDAGAKLHGCTVHFVTPGVDEGPAIGQAAVEVRANDTAETLAQRVLAAEHILYPLCLAALARGDDAISARLLPSEDGPVLINAPL